MKALLALLMGGVALGLLGYLLTLLFKAASFSELVQSLGSMLERAAFRRSVARCQEGDRLFGRGDLAGAVDAFSEAFFLKPLRVDAQLLSDVADHHAGLLSRLLAVADEMGKGRARLPSLAAVDRLLAERLELELERFRARKRGLEQQAREIERKLQENEQRVRESLNRLITEIRTSEEKVLYH